MTDIGNYLMHSWRFWFKLFSGVCVCVCHRETGNMFHHTEDESKQYGYDIYHLPEKLQQGLNVSLCKTSD